MSKSHALLIINLDMLYNYITPTSVTNTLADIKFYVLK